MTMRVQLLHDLPQGKAKEVLTTSASYGRRLIEQGKAVPAPPAPAPRKLEKREAPIKPKEGE